MISAALLKSIDNKTFAVTKDSGIADYMRSIRGLVYGLWRGSVDQFTFVDDMGLAISRGFTRAWTAGAASVGVQPSEITLAEKRALRQQINSELGFLLPFAEAIERGSKANRGLLRNVLRRAEMWINRYNGIYNQAKLMAAEDAKMEWQVGETEHCVDCARLNGRVYRASTWRDYNIRPQMATLECKGFRCQCRFMQTDKPCTPGHPPRIG